MTNIKITWKDKERVPVQLINLKSIDAMLWDYRGGMLRIAMTMTGSDVMPESRSHITARIEDIDQVSTTIL